VKPASETQREIKRLNLQLKFQLNFIDYIQQLTLLNLNLKCFIFHYLSSSSVTKTSVPTAERVTRNLLSSNHISKTAAAYFSAAIIAAKKKASSNFTTAERINSEAHNLIQW